MKSLRVRMAVWLGVSFIVVTASFMFMSYRLLEEELRQKSWQQDYPTHPDWKLHGSFSEAEVRDILGELLEATLIGAIPLLLASAVLGWWLARKSLAPISSVNQQLQAKTSANLSQPINLPEMDVEFRGLLLHLNDLLKRLDASFQEMNNYAAKVAHELRTPLAIMRLKVEQAGDRISPELAEELENELHRLTHVVEQSLLIARAELGRLCAERSPCDLAALVRDLAGDFELLANEEQRRLLLECSGPAWVLADPRHLRQIIHSLLTNALKHGQGDFTVRVRANDRRAALVIANRVEFCSLDHERTLGLGLRVVSVLLHLDPHVQFRRRRGLNYHVVRLTAPTTPASPGRPTPERSATSHSPAGTADEKFFI